MVKYYYHSDNKVMQSVNFPQGTFCWIDMVNPTDDEVEDVCSFAGFPEEMVKAALDEEERARTEFDEGNYLYIVDVPILEESDSGDVYTTLPLGLIYNKTCLATVCMRGNPVLKNFITNRDKVDINKPVNFLLQFMLGNAKQFLNCLRQIDRKSRRIQNDLEDAMTSAGILRLLDMENSLVYISTSLNSNARVHDKLSKVEAVATREENSDLYDDLVIESQQAMEMCNIYKDTLSVTMDAYGTVISNNANDSMKKLTVVTILLAIPTMIAGFWGMNMEVPFQYSKYGLIWFGVVAFAAIALTVGIGYIMMKQMKMWPTRQHRPKKTKKSKK